MERYLLLRFMHKKTYYMANFILTAKQLIDEFVHITYLKLS